MKLSKTNYLTYQACQKNAWLKIHKPEIYFAYPLSSFDQNIIDTGNEIDALARDLFPGGVLVEGRGNTEHTCELLAQKTPVIYQPTFETDRYTAACDIFVWNEQSGMYDLYEVKSSTASEDNGGRKTKDYLVDMAFQRNVLEEAGVSIGRTFLVRMNKKYVRNGALDIRELFFVEDLTEEVEKILPDTRAGMEAAYSVLSQTSEPKGNCDCILRGLNGHCTTSPYSNKDLPEYPVQAISRIHKNKLTELVDGNILNIHDVPEDFPLSDNQRRQVHTAQTGREYLDQEGLENFLEQIEYPIAFIDYETYPPALPRFDGYRPYQQIPFQFSLHIKESADAPVTHHEFLYTGTSRPDEAFAEAMKQHLPQTGSVIVWNEKFERGINEQLAVRLPEYRDFLQGVNSRMIDLMVPFSGKTTVYDHPGFRGSASIKAVLPTLVPELSYKELDIQEGGTASDTWNRIVSGEYPEEEAAQKAKALKKYCLLDTLAMVKIWEVLRGKMPFDDRFII